MTTPNRDETPLRWEITQHVCRCCFGRVLARTTFELKRVYRCADCGTQVEGQDTRVLCACGIKIRGKDGGIRCEENTRRTPEVPFEVTCSQVDAVAP